MPFEFPILLRLEEETDVANQRTNVSTLFTWDYLQDGNPTWLVLVEGASGNGCASGGDDPSFFDDLCP